MRHTEAVELVRTPDERFGELPGYPFTPRYVELPDGLRMHYVDEGPRGAETVLLLHGQPTWSYLYRKMIGGLVAHGLRAVAPDLVGFGRSDKPVARTAHSVRGHQRWMAQFTDAMGLRDPTLFVQDWGGPIGLGLLAERPGLVRRIVAANTALHTADASLAGRLAWPVHAADDGTVTVAQMLLDYQRLTQELTPLQPSLFVQGATASDVPHDVLAAYDAPFPDESFCAGPRQLPVLMALTPSSECAQANRQTLERLAGFDGPLLTAFSDGDLGTGGWAEVLEECVPDGRRHGHVTIKGAGHFLQEDRGADLADVVARFVAETPTERVG
jgi:haloalkane dehalogenase